LLAHDQGIALKTDSKLLLRVLALPCVCRYWWFSPTGSPQRQKVNFAVDGILVGPLLGKAVTIIGNQAAPGGVQYAKVHADPAFCTPL
jgi:hypothetical protein